MKTAENYEIDFSNRTPNKQVDELFVKRWSPRSFQKIEISTEIIESVIDAARWSPSAFNEQPWRFLTSTTETFDTFLNLLLESNQQWAKNSSVLGFIIAKKQFSYNNQNNRWANFDCGAAWMSLTLQARKFGLYTHGMAGFKQTEVYETFRIDKEKYRVICAFAIGKIDKPDKLIDKLRDVEKPSGRKALKEIWKTENWSE